MTNFCPECFGDKSLRSLLIKARPDFPDGEKCDFHPSRKGIPESYVVELIDGAIRSNYGWADANPYFNQGDSLSANHPFLAVSLCFKIIQKQWFSAFDVFRIIAFRRDLLQIRVGKGVGKEKWASSRPTCFEDRLSQGAITTAMGCS